MQIQSYQFEDWDRVLKIESEVLYELVIKFIVLYVSNCIRMLIFTDIEVLLGCKFSPINLRTGTETPVLKIEKGVLNELVINLIILYVSNCIRILIFTGIEVLIGCKFSPISLRTGYEPPVLKIAFRGILQLGSVLHRFLRLKLHKSGKFHAGIKFCTIDVTSDLTISCVSYVCYLLKNLNVSIPFYSLIDFLRFVKLFHFILALLHFEAVIFLF